MHTTENNGKHADQRGLLGSRTKRLRLVGILCVAAAASPLSWAQEQSFLCLSGTKGQRLISPCGDKTAVYYLLSWPQQVVPPGSRQSCSCLAANKHSALTLSLRQRVPQITYFTCSYQNTAQLQQQCFFFLPAVFCSRSIYTIQTVKYLQ